MMSQHACFNYLRYGMDKMIESEAHYPPTRRTSCIGRPWDFDKSLSINGRLLILDGVEENPVGLH
jgi:hypothetical protein